MYRQNIFTVLLYIEIRDMTLVVQRRTPNGEPKPQCSRAGPNSGDGSPRQWYKKIVYIYSLHIHIFYRHSFGHMTNVTSFRACN